MSDRNHPFGTIAVTNLASHHMIRSEEHTSELHSFPTRRSSDLFLV